MNLSFTDRLFLMAKALTGRMDLQEGTTGWKLLKGIMPGAVGAPPTRGTQAFLQGYSTMPWVRALAGKVGFSVAATPWRLYATKNPMEPKAHKRVDIQRCADWRVRKNLLQRAESQDSLTEINEHPLLDLLVNGNPLHSGLSIRKMAQVSLDLVGECFYLKERGILKAPGQNAPPPIALWPIPAYWIISTPTVTHDFYRVSFRGWQGFIPSSEIIWRKEDDPANPYWRGSGIGQALSDELETDEYTAKHLKQFFYNAARPDVIISPKGDLQSFGKDEMQRLDTDWQNQHGGFWRAFKPMFSTRPLEVTAFPQNFQHLQLTELRKSARDICLQVWGVSPEILGVIEHSNRATIDAADYNYTKWVLLPRLELERIDYQRYLVPEFDDRLIVDFVSPVQEDKEFTAKIMELQPWPFEADEIREVAGLPPLENEKGKFHMEPANMTRVLSWDEVAPPKPQPGPYGQPGESAPKPKPAQLAAAFDALSDEQLLDLALKMAEEPAHV